MIEIQLTHGKVALIDEEDLDLVRGFKWYAWKSSNTYYARTKVRREGGGHRTVLMHRLLLGVTDPKTRVDHRDGNGMNNRRENIRACTASQNSRNRGAQANNKSGYKGVCWGKDFGKWRAQIRANGKNRNLGYFATPEAAYEAYCRAAVELHGEFANLG